MRSMITAWISSVYVLNLWAVAYVWIMYGMFVCYVWIIYGMFASSVWIDVWTYVLSFPCSIEKEEYCTFHVPLR
jgi:hypothetical protein